LDATTNIFSFLSPCGSIYASEKHFVDIRTSGTFRTPRSQFGFDFRTSTDVLLSAPEDSCRMASVSDD